MWAGALGFISIILGALGAHALEKVLSPDSLESFHTAVRYQAWHSIALLAISFSPKEFPLRKWIMRTWVTGVILFSGSIYLLSTRTASGLDVSFLGPVTPLGGLLMILGWALVFVAALRYSGKESE